MKHLTAAEFADYVDDLEFEELEDIAAFVRSYFEAYKEIPEEDEEEKQNAWLKYVILTSRFAMTFVHYIEMSIEMRKEIEDQIKSIEEIST
jgi:hypothetical protein